MNNIELGRLAYITEQSITRRGLRPKYDRHKGYVACHQLLAEYQSRIAQLEAENAALKRVRDAANNYRKLHILQYEGATISADGFLVVVNELDDALADTQETDALKESNDD